MMAIGNGLVVVIILVFRISGSESSRRLSGFHPRSLIAFLFVLIRPNDLDQIMLIIGKISDFSKSPFKPILVRYNTNLDFSRTYSTFHDPFCSLASPTCHLCVPCGKPIQNIHRWS